MLADVLSNEPRGAGGAMGETSKQVSCPPGIVGRIIGRGGETIRSLQSGSGAHILVDQVRGCVVWGGALHPRSGRERGDPEDPGLRGSDRGPQGVCTGLFQTGTGCLTPTPPPPPTPPPAQNFPPEVNREITISGKADCVDRAYRMVCDLISGDPGSAQQVIQKVLGSVSGALLLLRCREAGAEAWAPVQAAWGFGGPALTG